MIVATLVRQTGGWGCGDAGCGIAGTWDVLSDEDVRSASSVIRWRHVGWGGEGDEPVIVLVHAVVELGKIEGGRRDGGGAVVSIVWGGRRGGWCCGRC